MELIKKQPIRNELGEMNPIQNFEPDKYYPGRPSCKYNGTTVECCSFVSESGGITADILVNVLKHFDRNNIFPLNPWWPDSLLAC